MRKIYIFCLFIISYLIPFSSNAQCPTASFTAPDTVCAGAPFTVTNTSTGNGPLSYQWDFCTGDLYNTPTDSVISSVTGLNAPSGIKIIHDTVSGKWYGFLSNTGTGVISRLDFGNSPTNTPTKTNLTGLPTYSGAYSMDFVNDSTIWYCLLTSSNNNTLYKLTFDKGLDSIPISTNLGNVGSFSYPYEVKIEKDSSNYICLITNNGNTTISRLNFGNSINNPSPTASIISGSDFNGPSGFAGITITRDCNNWIGFVSSYTANRVYKIDFGTSLLDTITSSNTSVIATISNPISDYITKEDSNYVLFVVGYNGKLSRLVFNNSLGLNDPSPVSSVIISGIYTRNFCLINYNSNDIGYSCGISDNYLYRISFPSACSALTPTSNLFSPPNSYSDTGTSHVMLKVSDTLGDVGYFSKDIVVVPNPISQITTSGLSCTNQSIVFNDASTISAGTIIQWNWHFGDGDSSKTQNSTHTFIAGGTYSTTLTVTSKAGCSASSTKDITIYDTPTPNFTFANECYGIPVNFTDSSVIGNDSIASWNWNFGDANTSNTQNTSHLYSSNGGYNAMLAIQTYHGCKDSIQKSVTIYPDPVPGFASSNTCGGQPVQFTDTSTLNGGTIVSDAWNFGDGNSSTQQNPAHQYASTGTYNVQLIATGSNGCSDSITQATIVSQPIANFNGPSNACKGAGVNFTDSSYGGNIVNWKWYFGDGDSSSVQNPVHIYTSPGTFNVMLIATAASNCPVSITKSITITDSPVANFTTTENCFGQATSFTNTSTTPSGTNFTSSSWSWNFGDTTNSVDSLPPPHLYTTSGTHQVMLAVVNNMGCRDTIIKNAMVDPLPVPAFSTNNPTCSWANTAFTNNTSISTGSVINQYWNFGDPASGTNDTSSVFSANHLYNQPNSYNVQLIAYSDKGCVDSTTQTITVHQSPVADFNVLVSCINDSVHFADVSTNALAWSWNFGDTTTSSLQNPSKLFASVGNYNVSLTVTDSIGCSHDTTKTIDVHPAPTADFTENEVCLHQATNFVNNSITEPGTNFTSSAWSWNFGDNTTSTDSFPTHIYSTSGNQTVTLAVINNIGCRDTITKTVVVDPLPAPSFTTNSPVCSGSNTFFINNQTISSGTVTSQAWNFGDSSSGGANTSSIKSPTHIYYQPGNYLAQLVSFSDKGCSDTANQTIVVEQSPVANFTVTTSCINDSVHFTDASNNAISWYWDFGITTSTSTNPSVLYPDTGSHSISLIVTAANGCSNSIVKSIDVHPAPTADFNDTSICAETSHQFMDASSVPDGTISQWNWDFSGLGNSSIQNPSYTFPVANTYPVTLTVTSADNCTSSVTKNVVVHALPVANYTYSPSVVIPGTPINFNNQSTGADSANWHFGNTGQSDSLSPEYVFPDTSSYTVCLLAISNYGCKDSLCQAIDVVPANLDLAVIDVSTTNSNNSIVISADLANLGTEEINSFDIYAYLRNGSKIKESWSGSLLPGHVMTYHFNASYEINSDQDLSYICVDALNPNGRTDDVASNNSACTPLVSGFKVTDFYPNPTDNESTVRVIVPQNGTLQVELYNLLGQNLGTLYNGDVSSGLNKLSISTLKLRKSIYEIRFSYGDQTIVKSLMKK